MASSDVALHDTNPRYGHQGTKHTEDTGRDPIELDTLVDANMRAPTSFASSRASTTTNRRHSHQGMMHADGAGCDSSKLKYLAADAD